MKLEKPMLLNFAVRVLDNNIREHRPVGFVRQVRAEADAGVEWPVNVQADGRAELMHRFSLQTDEERERVAVFFNADASGIGGDQVIGRFAAGQSAAAADAI